MPNDLNSKVEEALKSVVDGLSLAGVTVNTGVDDSALEVPYVICSAPNAGEEEIRYTGWFNVEAVVKVASSADDDTLATHRARVASVRDEILDGDIGETLSAAVSGFYVPYMGVLFQGLLEETEERRHVSSILLDIRCCSSDVAA